MRKYGVDLSALSGDYGDAIGRIQGEVMVEGQYAALEKFSRHIASSIAPYQLQLDVEILAQLERTDSRLPYRIPHNCDSPVPIFTRSDNDKLTTEWLPEDGAARLLHQAPRRWLLQFADGAVGWCDSQGLLKVQAEGESGPFVEQMGRGELLDAGQGAIAEMAVLALELSGLKIPYKLGGRSLAHGLDCSALIQHIVFKLFNRRLPRHTTDQMKVGRRVARNMLSPGDLVYCRSQSMNFMHVGIVVEEEQVVHACRHADLVVRQPLAVFFECYRFLKARRLTREE